MGAIKIVCLVIVFFSFSFGKTLKIGILPYTDPLKILTIHQPLKTFLETQLQEKVEIYSSSSYENFFEETKNNHFDLIITGPHFGLIHLQDRFIPLFRYNTELQPIFIVRKESSYHKVKDLKNKKISLSNYLSVSSIGGIKSLVDEGFRNGIDFKLLNSPSHTSAVMSVVLDEADGAITTFTPLKQLTDEAIKSKIRYFESGFHMPHLFTIGSPKLSQNEIDKLRKSLVAFEQSTIGKQFFSQTGYIGYTKITKKDLDAMEAVLDETKAYLKIK